MPGRLNLYDDTAFKHDIRENFGLFRDDIGALKKRYNIAPTINIPIYTLPKYIPTRILDSYPHGRTIELLCK